MVDEVKVDGCRKVLMMDSVPLVTLFLFRGGMERLGDWRRVLA